MPCSNTRFLDAHKLHSLIDIEMMEFMTLEQSKVIRSIDIIGEVTSTIDQLQLTHRPQYHTGMFSMN